MPVQRRCSSVRDRWSRRRRRGGVEVDVGGAEPMTVRCRFAGELRRLPRAWPRLAYYRNAAGPDPNSILREGQLLPHCPDVHRSRGLSAPVCRCPGGLRRSSDDRSWWSGALRPRRTSGSDADVTADGCDACRQHTPRCVNHWPALKDHALQPGYAGNPAEDHAARCTSAGFRGAGLRRLEVLPGADQPVRHRKPRIDGVAGTGRLRVGGGGYRVATNVRPPA